MTIKMKRHLKVYFIMTCEEPPFPFFSHLSFLSIGMGIKQLEMEGGSHWH
jgi:hypothetical protein